MIQSASELVARYRALPFLTDHLGDCSDNHLKSEILRSIDEHATHPDVSRLLLDVLNAPLEYDLARIEAIKIVRLYVDDSSPLERDLKRQIWKIFSNKDDDVLVRQHASQNFSVGFGGDDEL